MIGEAALPLAEPEELLHRQVHPGWINDGRVSSQAFQPTKKDAGQLSVSRGSLVSSREAFVRHLAKGLASAGTWSVLVLECGDAGTPVFADPIQATDPRGLAQDDAHAFVDFRGLGGGAAQKRVADKLATKARERGATFLPPGKSTE